MSSGNWQPFCLGLNVLRSILFWWVGTFLVAIESVAKHWVWLSPAMLHQKSHRHDTTVLHNIQEATFRCLTDICNSRYDNAYWSAIKIVISHKLTILVTSLHTIEAFHPFNETLRPPVAFLSNHSYLQSIRSWRCVVWGWVPLDLRGGGTNFNRPC